MTVILGVNPGAVPMIPAEVITTTAASMELKVPTFLKAIRPTSSPATGPKEATRNNTHTKCMFILMRRRNGRRSQNN